MNWHILKVAIRQVVTSGPKLMQFSRYTYMLYENVSTKLFFHLFMFYRLVFEFALQKDSQNRSLEQTFWQHSSFSASDHQFTH